MTGLIRLLNVCYSVPAAGGARRLVFGRTTLAIPTEHIIAVVGGRGEGKTTLLKLIAGVLKPDEGAVLRPSSISPIINGGRFLHAGLTGHENVRFIARCYGLDATTLTLAVNAFCGIGARLADPVSMLDSSVRRSLEAALAMVMPFACYLMDDAQQMPPELLARCLEAVRARASSLIFATANAQLARANANLIMAVENATAWVVATDIR
jgi:capsular polysaccharide transport system ATP-binding protein